MRKILEELWYGNVCPGNERHEVSKEARQFMKCLANQHENLYLTLTDEQKGMLEKMDECCSELTDIYEREIFVNAFRLGARIALEIMD